MQLFLKIFSEMANSVDPDQTAPKGAVWSGSTLFAYDILSKTLENIRDGQTLGFIMEWSWFRVMLIAELYCKCFK